MRTHHVSIPIATKGKVRSRDVTDEVRKAVGASEVDSGFVLVSVPHTTCALFVNENEEGLRNDLERLAEHVLDTVAQEGPFAHDRIDNNARAHLTSVLFGHQVVLPVHEGDLVLGTWQSLFLMELDGPRQRTLQIHVFGA